MFYDILQKLCRENGLSVSAALKIMGVSSGNISHWKKGRLPKGKTLRRIAQFFDVPIDFLIGDKQKLLAAQQEQMLAMFTSVPEEKRDGILQSFKAMVDSIKSEGQMIS